MPPIRRFEKEDIINTAYLIAQKEGLNSINARRIAKEMNSSIQPIFHNFSTMEELKKKVYEKIYETYKSYMLSGIDDENAYKNTGLSYIKFAKDYPEFFKIIFMQKTNLNAKGFVMADSMGDEIIKAGQKSTGLSFEEQKNFHVKVWIFTHGIACLVATNTVSFSDNDIDKLLKDTVYELVIGYKIKEERK